MSWKEPGGGGRVGGATIEEWFQKYAPYLPNKYIMGYVITYFICFSSY